MFGRTVNLIAISIFCVTGWSPCVPQQQSADRPVLRQSVRTDKFIHLQPSGAVFELPQRWLDKYAESGNNLHFSPAELAHVRGGYGVEWKTQYADILNAAWRFDECAFAGGSDGWGPKVVNSGDLQMRTYVADTRPGALRHRLDHALSTANKIHLDGLKPFSPAGRKQYTPTATFSETAAGTWQKSVITFHVFFGDYDGTAGLHFYSTECGKYTVTLAFMRAETNDPRLAINDEEEAEVAHSFSCPTTPAAPSSQ